MKLTIVLSALLFAWTNASAQETQLSKDSSVVQTDSVQPLQQLKNGKHVNDMISFAKSLLGTPYRYSGTSPSGFDCSGFINYVMGSFGFSLPRSSYSIAELGKTVKLSEVQPGDLLF